MDVLETYLANLQSKVFKLLPMREAYDEGDTNHLDEYLINLCANCEGAFSCHPVLSGLAEVVEVRNNIEFLKNNLDLEFVRWRAIVLRSTRLVHSAMARLDKGGSQCL